MTSPVGVFLDSAFSPSNSEFWVISATEVWFSSNVLSPITSWSSKFSAAALEAQEGLSEAKFYRVVAPADGLVYLLAAALPSPSASQFTAYLCVSHNLGASWTVHIIEEGIDANTDRMSYSGGVFIKEITAGVYRADLPITPFGGDCAAKATSCVIQSPNNSTPRWVVYDLGHEVYAEQLTWRSHVDGDWWVDVSKNLVGWETISNGRTSWTVAECKTRLINIVESKRTFRYIKFKSLQLTLVGDHIRLAWFSWPEMMPVIPSAMDASRTNVNWVYVGLEDKIVATEDGGENWFTFIEDHGANDVHVDPQLAGALYYWAKDGNLNLAVKQVLGQPGTIQEEGIMTESPLNVPLRIARDVNSGRLLAIPGGTDLKMRNLGVVTTLQSGLSNGRGLHVYLGQKFICLDNADIYVCDNLQAASPTIALKKGTWTTYGNGVNSHRAV